MLLEALSYAQPHLFCLQLVLIMHFQDIHAGSLTAREILQMRRDYRSQSDYSGLSGWALNVTT